MSEAARQKKYRIVVCRGPECGEQRNSAAVHAAFLNEVTTRRLETRVELAWQSCFGRCRQGPNVLCSAVEPTASRFLFALAPSRGDAAMYNGVTPADVPRILTEHVLGGRMVRDLIKKPELSTAGVGETLRSQQAVEPGRGDGSQGGGGGEPH